MLTDTEYKCCPRGTYYAALLLVETATLFWYCKGTLGTKPSTANDNFEQNT